MSLLIASVGYTIKAIQGKNVHLPCHFPSTSQVNSNALWIKEANEALNTEDENNKKIELLYPLDHDQTILLREVALEDAGVYHCESAEKEKLSTIYLIVEGRFGNPFYILLLYYCYIIAVAFLTSAQLSFSCSYTGTSLMQ